MYSKDVKRTTLDREAAQNEARRANETRRKEAVQALNEMNVIKVQKAVGRARRSTTTTTKDGRIRTYRIGQNVASMCSWLLFWEGKGELSGGWIYKSLPEWVEETELTESMVRTARRIGKEEELWEEAENNYVRSDGREVVKYRLNVVRLLQIANASEIENVEARRTRARNDPSKRAELDRELGKLEAIRKEMGLFDALPDADTESTPEDPANLTGYPCEHSIPPPSISPDYRGVPRSSTAGDSPEGTLSDDSVVGGLKNAASDRLLKNKKEDDLSFSRTFSPETENAMRIVYAQLKAAGIKVPRWRYAAMKCDLDRGWYTAEDPAWLAGKLIEHYEATGVVDHDAAWVELEGLEQ